LLLSKALKMQQYDEDRKNEVIVKGLEDKIKEHEDSLTEKDELLRSAKGFLAEVQVQNKKLSKELAYA
jgi:N12 class adenine-specific DNA methylase